MQSGEEHRRILWNSSGTDIQIIKRKGWGRWTAFNMKIGHTPFCCMLSSLSPLEQPNDLLLQPSGISYEIVFVAKNKTKHHFRNKSFELDSLR